MIWGHTSYILATRWKSCRKRDDLFFAPWNIVRLLSKNASIPYTLNLNFRAKNSTVIRRQKFHVAFSIIFCHIEIDLSGNSVRPQYWMRLFLWFSKTVQTICPLPQEFAGICPVVLSRNEENLPLKRLITQKLTVWSNVYDFCQSQQKSLMRLWESSMKSILVRISPYKSISFLKCVTSFAKRAAKSDVTLERSIECRNAWNEKIRKLKALKS